MSKCGEVGEGCFFQEASFSGGIKVKLKLLPLVLVNMCCCALCCFFVTWYVRKLVLHNFFVTVKGLKVRGGFFGMGARRFPKHLPCHEEPLLASTPVHQRLTLSVPNSCLLRGSPSKTHFSLYPAAVYQGESIVNHEVVLWAWSSFLILSLSFTRMVPLRKSERNFQNRGRN